MNTFKALVSTALWLIGYVLVCWFFLLVIALGFVILLFPLWLSLWVVLS